MAYRLSRSCILADIKFTNHAWIFSIFPNQLPNFSQLTHSMQPLPDPVLWIILTVFGYKCHYQCVICCYFQSVSGLTVSNRCLKRTSVLGMAMTLRWISNSSCTYSWYKKFLYIHNSWEYSIVALLGCWCCSSVTNGLFVNMYSHVTLSFVLLGVKSKSH